MSSEVSKEEETNVATEETPPVEENVQAESAETPETATESPPEQTTAPAATSEPEAPATPAPPSAAPVEVPAAEELPAAVEAVADSAQAAIPETTPPTTAEIPAAEEIPTTAEAAQVMPDEKSEPKIRLNPSQPAPVRAVPMFEGKQAAEDTGPVEVPRDAEIDGDVAAQIDAALESGSAPQTASAAGGEPITPPAEHPDEASLQPDVKLAGLIQSVHGENVFLDLGYRSPGIALVKAFHPKHPPQVGQKIDVFVKSVNAEEGLIHVNPPRGGAKISADWAALSKGQTVHCTVTSKNKGGLQVQVGNLRGFMPASQVDTKYVEDLETYVGQKFEAEVTECNPRRKNLVLSRRAVLERDRKEAEDMLWTILEVGQQYSGKVKTIKDYGVFVDIGGVDGFLHVGDISWNRVRHPRDAVNEGDDVTVKVISLDREKKKIGLGLKQLADNPWATAPDKYPADSEVTGRVTKVTEFGAFVELEPNVEALVHISELAHRRVHKVTEILRHGEEYTFKVLSVDPRKKRISLSYKALQDAPVDQRKQRRRNTEEELPDGGDYSRKNSGPLKGGIGGDTAGGGLFGNPDDYQ